MALESATYISDLNSSNPAASDAISTADDHLRLIKSTIKATFPNITGPVTLAQGEFAPLASPTFTGTPAAPTASAGTNTTQVATTAFVTAATTAERTATATLTNKTISADSNTLSGLAASSFVVSDASGNIDGSAAQKAIPSGTVVGTSDTQTLTNKTINASQLVDASITTAKIADGAVTAEKLANALTRDTVKNSTSGTAVDFTGIPSWVKRITVIFNAVSTSSTSPMIIQLGDSGGIETTSYTNHNSAIGTGAASASFSAGFGLTVSTGYHSSTRNVSGNFIITNISGNIWIASGVLNNWDGSVGYTFTTAGSKTLSDVLTQVRITTSNGTDTFDAGSINILYE